MPARALRLFLLKVDGLTIGQISENNECPQGHYDSWVVDTTGGVDTVVALKTTNARKGITTPYPQGAGNPPAPYLSENNECPQGHYDLSLETHH